MPRKALRNPVGIRPGLLDFEIVVFAITAELDRKPFDNPEISGCRADSGGEQWRPVRAGPGANADASACQNDVSPDGTTW